MREASLWVMGFDGMIGCRCARCAWSGRLYLIVDGERDLQQCNSPVDIASPREIMSQSPVLEMENPSSMRFMR